MCGLNFFLSFFLLVYRKMDFACFLGYNAVSGYQKDRCVHVGGELIKTTAN